MQEFFYNAAMEMSLEKILQRQGFGSRKLCRTLVVQGRVHAENAVCTDPGRRFETNAFHFSVDGQQWLYREHLYLVLNKPAGFECSHQPQHHSSVFTLLPMQFIQWGLQCVGRLDQDTTGLLLLSDDGDFIHRYTSPKKKVPKVYDISTNAEIDELQIEKLKNGVQLKDETAITKALSCESFAECRMRLVITEGKYHQVKRMVAAAGNRVEKLHRSAIGGLVLDDSLPSGQWRYLDDNDLKKLNGPTGL